MIIPDRGPIIAKLHVMREQTRIFKQRRKLTVTKDPAITLVNCLGKLFTAIINSLLSLLADEYLISECQTGFREGHSTTDNICSLHAHIYYLVVFFVWLKMFCSFIDFRNAFDTVWRNDRNSVSMGIVILSKICI